MYYLRNIACIFCLMISIPSWGSIIFWNLNPNDVVNMSGIDLVTNGGYITSFNYTVGLFSCGAAASGASKSCLSPWNSDLNRVETSISCSVNGEPFQDTIRYNGITIQLFFGSESSLTLSEQLLSGSGIANTNLNVKLSGEPYMGTDTIAIACVVSTSRSGLTGDSRPAYNGLYVDTVSYTKSITFTNMSAYSITISNPTHILGPTNHQATSHFFIEAPSMMSSATFTWDVGEPCRNWNPYLTVGGRATPIGIGYVDEGYITGGSTPVTAYFTPTAAGAFTCSGILRFNFD